VVRRSRTWWKAPSTRAARALIEPLGVLPERHGLPDRGELRLMAALMGDALDLVVGGRGVSRHTTRRGEAVADAERWIAEGTIGLFSFDACCAWLGLDAPSVRRAVVADAVTGRKRITAEEMALSEESGFRVVTEGEEECHATEGTHGPLG
jgi:hypothetical protein